MFVSPIRFANAKRVAASASALLEVPAPYNKEEIIEIAFATLTEAYATVAIESSPSMTSF